MAKQNEKQQAQTGDKPRQQPPADRSRGGGTPLARQQRSPALLTPSLLGMGSSPFVMMRRMMEDMDRLFDDFGFGRSGSLGYASPFSPQVEVVEQGGDLIIRADLPGMKEEDVRVEARGDQLVLEGERKSEEEREEGGVWRSERSYGSFRRAIPLPEGIDLDDVSARFENGVLEVRMKLPAQQQKSRRIAVSSGGAERDQAGQKPEKEVQPAPAPSVH
jgi:HSP20 family protein